MPHAKGCPGDSEPHGLKGWEWGTPPDKSCNTGGGMQGKQMVHICQCPKGPHTAQTSSVGDSWGEESGQVDWQKHVRGLGFHDEDLRLFLGGTGEICNQESDRDRFSWKNNP